MNERIADVLTAAGVDPAYVEALVRATLAEDLAGGLDVTSEATIPPAQHATAELVARGDGVVAGLAVAAAVFDAGGMHLVELVKDGATVRKGDVLAVVEGPTKALLTAERTALNLLCHLSGVATATRRWADALASTGAQVRDTRKTTPGLRILEKYAVRCGGGVNHRASLSAEALVKDNHVLAAGGVVPAYQAVRTRFPQIPVEVECQTVAQVRDVVTAGCDFVLCDNMPDEVLADAVRAARAINPDVRLEASGGLTLDRAAGVAATGVDYISVGGLTHSAPVLDIAMDLRS